MKIAEIEKFEDLEIWQLARDLCIAINELAKKSPLNKDFRLRDQIKSSSGSIMDNIAEGFERDGNKEFIQFLSISKSSCGETRSQLYRCFDFGYLEEENLIQLTKKCFTLSTKINNLRTYLKNSQVQGRKFKSS